MRASASTRSSEQSRTPEHVSAAKLEEWESYHTELGCLYVEFTQKHLQRIRKENAELDL